MNVIVIGAHGKIALLLARELANRGDTVTGVVRNPDHVADVEASGARALVLDIEHASTEEIAEALSGHDAVVWSAGAGGGDPERTYAVDRDAAIRTANAAQSTGVRRFIMVSFAQADVSQLVPLDDPFYPYQASKIAADEHLRASSLDWTILGPGRLTAQPATGNVTDADTERGAPSDTSRANVALVVAEALADPATAGRTLNFRDGDVPIREWIARNV